MRRHLNPLPGFYLGLLAGGLAVANARADLRLKMELEHRQILPYETANVVIEFVNDSDYPLVLGGEDDGRNAEARFLVKYERTDVEVPLRRTGPLWKRLRLKAGETRKEIVALSEWCDLSREGRYTVQFEVDWFGTVFVSPSRLMEVVRGIELTKVSRDLSGYWGRTRVYSLRYWPRGGYEYLFLSVDEPEGGGNYGLFLLGPLIRVFNPILEVDRKNRVKVIHQSALDRYTRTIFESLPDHVQFVDQTYHLPSGEAYPTATRSQDEIADLDAVLAGKAAAEAQKKQSLWSRSIRAVGRFLGGKQTTSTNP